MFDVPNILLAITALVNAGLVLFIYSRNRESPINRSFALFVLFLSFWALVILQFRLVEAEHISLYLLKFAYVAAILIAACFYYFSGVFPTGIRPSRFSQMLLYGACTAMVIALLLPGFLTKSVIYHDWGKEVLLGVPEFVLFAGLFIYLFIGGQLRLWLKVPGTTGLLRIQLLYIAASVSGIGLIGIYYNLALPSPWVRDFQYVWTGPIFTTIFATVITYSIFRYKLFNTKAIFAELIVFGLWVFIFIRALLAESFNEQVINAILLGVMVVLGLILIRSVNKEVRAREEIERLARDLERANIRLKELDRLKSEFVSIASHQLRSPLTAIRGYASLILEGSFGRLVPSMREAVERIGESAKNMAISVDDFLNVSRIEQGRMKYEYSEFDFAELVHETVEELRPVIEQKGLRVSLAREEKTMPVKADKGKLKQVLTNLIDNAAKYTPKGSLSIALSRVGTFVRFAITDTGVGISKENLPRLFDKFVRAGNANEVNVQGTGLGLYVAKQLVEAQGGRIWAESPGEGKGSSFFVEFPATRK